MEATGHYGEDLAEYLHTEQISISVVNPLQIKNFAKALLVRNKNDRIDAKIIAEYCKRMQPVYGNHDQKIKNVFAN
jgi:transposase